MTPARHSCVLFSARRTCDLVQLVGDRMVRMRGGSDCREGPQDELETRHHHLLREPPESVHGSLGSGAANESLVSEETGQTSTG